jgi:hypothetical protein
VEEIGRSGTVWPYRLAKSFDSFVVAKLHPEQASQERRPRPMATASAAFWKSSKARPQYAQETAMTTPQLSF